MNSTRLALGSASDFSTYRATVALAGIRTTLPEMAAGSALWSTPDTTAYPSFTSESRTSITGTSWPE